jgi:hypothetical protein
MHQVGFHYTNRDGDFACEQNDLSRSSRAMDVVAQCQVLQDGHCMHVTCTYYFIFKQIFFSRTPREDLTLL